MVHDLNPKNLQFNGLFFFVAKTEKPFLGGVSGRYPQNEFFLKKSGSVSFFALTS